MEFDDLRSNHSTINNLKNQRLANILLFIIELHTIVWSGNYITPQTFKCI